MDADAIISKLVMMSMNKADINTLLALGKYEKFVDVILENQELIGAGKSNKNQSYYKPLIDFYQKISGQIPTHLMILWTNYSDLTCATKASPRSL